MSTRIPIVLISVLLCVTVGVVVVDAQKLYTSTDSITATGFATVYPNSTEVVLEHGTGAFVASEVDGTILGSTDPNTIPFTPLFSSNFYDFSVTCQHQRTPILLNARQGLNVAENTLIGSTNISMMNASVLYMFIICQAAGTATATGGDLYVTISNDFGLTWVDPVAVSGLGAAGTLLLASTSVLVSESKWVLPVFLISKNGYTPTNGCLTRVVIEAPSASSLSSGGSVDLTATIVSVASTDNSKITCENPTDVEPIAAAVSVSSSVAVDGTVLFITQGGNATGSTTPLKVISCATASSTLCTVIASSTNTSAFVAGGKVQVPGLMVSSTFATTVQNTSTASVDVASVVGVHESVQETIRLYSGANATVAGVLSDSAVRVASRSPMEILPSNMVPSNYFITLTGISMAFLPTLPVSSSLDSTTSADVGMGEGQRVANFKQDSTAAPSITALVTFSSKYIDHIDDTNTGRVNASLDVIQIVLAYPPPGPAPLSNGQPVLAASITFSILGAVSAVLIGFFFVGKCADNGEGPEEDDDVKQPYNEPEDSERAPLVRASEAMPISAGAAVNKEIHAGDIYTPQAGRILGAATGNTRESGSVQPKLPRNAHQAQSASVNSD